MRRLVRRIRCAPAVTSARCNGPSSVGAMTPVKLLSSPASASSGTKVRDTAALKASKHQVSPGSSADVATAYTIVPPVLVVELVIGRLIGTEPPIIKPLTTWTVRHGAGNRKGRPNKRSRRKPARTEVDGDEPTTPRSDRSRTW